MRERIRQIREFLGLSVEDLANRTGASVSAIYKRERGDLQLGWDWLVTLAKVYGLPPARMVDTEIPVSDLFEPADRKEDPINRAAFLLSTSTTYAVLQKYGLNPDPHEFADWQLQAYFAAVDLAERRGGSLPDTGTLSFFVERLADIETATSRFMKQG